MVNISDTASTISRWLAECGALGLRARLNRLPVPVSSSDLEIRGVVLSRDGETPCVEFVMGDSLYVTIEFDAKRRIGRPHFSIGITDGGWKPIGCAVCFRERSHV